MLNVHPYVQVCICDWITSLLYQNVLLGLLNSNKRIFFIWIWVLESCNRPILALCHRRDNPDHEYSHRRENLKSYIFVLSIKNVSAKRENIGHSGEI
jgi:hypothetical protein